MKLLLRSNLFLLLFSLCLLLGCAKEDAFKNPTAVTFNVEMNPLGIGASDDLTFSDGYVIINRFTVLGKRSVGEDFEFSRTFQNGLKIPFHNSLTLEDLSFELPQGDYEQLQIRFETAADNNRPNLFVEGKYIYNNPLKPASTVHLAWNSAQVFEIDVLSQTGASAFTLNENKQETPNIIFQPKPWFANVTELMLESASFVSLSFSEQIMTIDETTNRAIFTEIDSKLATELKCSL